MNEEKLYCKNCYTLFKDKHQYIEHLTSKAHVKNIMKVKYGANYLEAKEKLEDFSKSTNINIPVEKIPALPNKNAKEKSEDSSSDTVEEEDVYTCKICRKICTGYINFQLHLSGKKHQRNLTTAKLLKEMKENNSIPEPYAEKPPEEQSLMDMVFMETKFASSDIKCQICQIKCCGPKAFQQHTEGASHRKKLAMQKLMQEMKSEGISEGDDNPLFRSCDACQKTFTGPLPYQQHMESPAHLKRTQHLKAITKIKALIITDEEVSRNLQCKECRKEFSGSIPFNAHLKSSAHETLKKKSAQMEDLEKKHPEMLRIPKQQDSESADNDTYEGILACDVCHLVFNGPESAKDHFESVKHTKKAKNKKQFQKYMKQQKGTKSPKASGFQGTLPTVQLENENDDKEFEMIEEV